MEGDENKKNGDKKDRLERGQIKTSREDVKKKLQKEIENILSQKKYLENKKTVLHLEGERLKEKMGSIIKTEKEFIERYSEHQEVLKKEKELEGEMDRTIKEEEEIILKQKEMEENTKEEEEDILKEIDEKNQKMSLLDFEIKELFKKKEKNEKILSELLEKEKTLIILIEGLEKREKNAVFPEKIEIEKERWEKEKKRRDLEREIINKEKEKDEDEINIQKIQKEHQKLVEKQREIKEKLKKFLFERENGQEWEEESSQKFQKDYQKLIEEQKKKERLQQETREVEEIKKGIMLQNIEKWSDLSIFSEPKIIQPNQKAQSIVEELMGGQIENQRAINIKNKAQIIFEEPLHSSSFGKKFIIGILIIILLFIFLYLIDFNIRSILDKILELLNF